VAACLNEFGDLAPMFKIKHAKIACDMDRRTTTGGAFALLPAGLIAVEHSARAAVYRPTMELVAVTVHFGKFLSDLPTASHQMLRIGR
jgi:hypothetical protein